MGERLSSSDEEDERIEELLVGLVNEDDHENGGYAYDFHRLDSVREEPAQAVSVGATEEDIRLDWRSPEQRRELAVWWSYAWPTMILFFASQSYTFIDLAFLGHLGQDSTDYLAASAQAGILFDISMAIFMRGFLQVLTVLCSQAYGAGKYSLVGQWLQVCLVVCIFSGIPILVLWWYSADVLDSLFGLDAKIKERVREFSHWSMFRLYPELFSITIRQFCLAQKIIKPLVVIAVLGIFLNLILNQVFIHGAFGLEGLGFIGSPIATSTTNAAILAVSFFYVFYWRTDIGKCWPGWSLDSLTWPRMREFLKQGLPLTLATCLEDFQFQAISSFAIKMSHTKGSWVISTHNGLLSFLLSCLSFQWGVMKSTSVRSAHYIGAKDIKHAKLVAKIAFVVSTIVSVVCALALLLSRDFIGYIFSNDIQVVHEVSKLIPPLSVGYVALSIFYISMAMLDSQGRPNVVAVGFFVGAWVVAVPLAYVLGITADMGLLGLWLGIMVGYGVTTAYLSVSVVRTDWNAVIEAAVARNNLSDDEVQVYHFNRSPAASVVSADMNPFPSPVLS